LVDVLSDELKDAHLLTLDRKVKVGSVPRAEVNPGNLKVGFGDVGYQGVTESEAEYIVRGADTQLICIKQSLHIYKLDRATTGHI